MDDRLSPPKPKGGHPVCQERSPKYMYVVKSPAMTDRGAQGPALMQEVPDAETRTGISDMLQTVIYLDPRAFTRDCVGGWLQSSLAGFAVRVLSDPDQIGTLPL